MNKIPVIWSTGQVYESTREHYQLVQPSELTEGEDYKLFMKTDDGGVGRRAKSYLANVRVDDIEYGSHIGVCSLRVILMDDKKQAIYAIDGINRNGCWIPDRPPLRAHDQLGEVAVSSGLLLPCDTELDDSELYKRYLKIADEPTIHSDR